ncbi:MULTISPECIES: hypothetical protein [unclassified Microbacterium]|uniref:hypothetical protein n=1 Tax=unclassified Microbacterium TaxID=2609290 RepID=UPI00301A054E
MTAAQADKLHRAYAIGLALVAITAIHEEEFTAAQRPMVPPPMPVDEAAIRRAYTEAALKGVSVFRRSVRKALTADAAARATAAAAQESAERRIACHQEQARLDRLWEALLRNDPSVVMDQLGSAFEDNKAPAAPLGVDGSEATLTVLIPGEHTMPEQVPGHTAAGNVSIRKMTKRERDELYTLLVAGYLLVTVKEAFAVAPSLTSVRIVAVSSAGRSAYGKRRGHAVAAAVISRESLIGVHWSTVDARTVLGDVASELLLNERGANKVLHAIDLSTEPELDAIMSAIDFDELGDA